MPFTNKTVQSRPGLSQEEALTSLQDHPLYRPGTKIASIRRRGDRWVAELLEPKTAGEMEDETGEEEGPPAPATKKPAFAEEGGDEGDEGGDEEGGDPEAEGPDGPPGEGAPGRPKGSEKAEIGQLLHVVQQIADALGIAPAPEPGMGGPDDLGPGLDGPGGPPAPPHEHGGPMGGGGLPPVGPPKPGAAGIGAKLKPGEVPNKPGTVPLGAPAFAASTHTANPGMGASAVDVPMPQAPGAAPGVSGCPHGYPDSTSCPQCQAQGPGAQPGAAGGMGIVGRARAFTASKRTNVTLAQAKYALESEFGAQGYRVEQIRRDGDIVRALLVA